MTWLRRPRRSTACCCGITTSYRSGTIRKSAPRAGTVLAARLSCPNTACRVSRRSGGSTPTRPPGSASDLEGFSAHGGLLSPACTRSRHRRAERNAVSVCNSSRCWHRRPWHVGLRRSEISGGLSSIRLRQCERAPWWFVFDHPVGPRLQSVVPDLQLAQCLYSQGRRRAGHGHDICDVDGSRRRRARRDVWPCREGRDDLTRRFDLSLHAAAGSRVPQRHKAHCP